MRTVPRRRFFPPAVCIVKAKGCPAISAFPTIRRASESLDDSLLLLLKESYSPDSGSRYITKRSVIPDLPDLKYTV